MTSTESTEPMGSDGSSTERSLYGCCDNPKCLCLPAKCLCVGAVLRVMARQKEQEQRKDCPPACAEAHTYSGSCMLRADGPKSDTPEVQASCGTCPRADNIHAECPCDEGKAICGNCYTDHAQGSCEPTEAPPQPLRRPPYAVAYSVAGHLYEIALPGDAAVQATDGGLIITHTLGPVAGVVRVHPIEGEQS